MGCFKRILFGFVVGIVVLSVGFFIFVYPKYTVPILMYHNVRDADPRDAISVSVNNFERQMSFLRDHHYTVLRLEDFVHRTAEGNPFPRNTVVVTFDDGPADNYHIAFPILKKYKIPSTIFVASRLVGTEGFMTEPQLQEMTASGLVEIGGHTADHKYLPDLSRDRQRYEITQNKIDLEGQLGREIKSFAYPTGGFDDVIKKMVKEAGYTSACTTNRGSDRFNKDLYELKRVRLGNKDRSALVLWWKLSGYYNLVRKEKKPF